MGSQYTCVDSPPMFKQSHSTLTMEVNTNMIMVCIRFLQPLVMLMFISYLSIVYVSPVMFHLKHKADEIESNEFILTQYLPLLMLPLISYLVITHVWPVISFHVKEKVNSYFYIKQDESFDDEQQTKVEVAKRWKTIHLGCAYGANTLIYMIFYVQPVKLIHLLVDLDKGLHSVDQYILYLNTVLAVLVLTLLTVIVTAGLVFKYRKISFISTVSMSISINIIYMVCYSFPRMAVEFSHDPLLAVYTCLMAMSIAVSLYPLLFYCSGMTLLSRMAMKHAYVALFPFKYFFISAVFALSCFCFMFIIIIFGAIVVTESHSDYHYLRLSYFLMCLLAISLFKPIHHCAYKHAIANAKLMLTVLDPNNPWMDDDEDSSNSISYSGANQDLVHQSNGKLYTEIKGIDNNLQSDYSTIV